MAIGGRKTKANRNGHHPLAALDTPIESLKRSKQPRPEWLDRPDVGHNLPAKPPRGAP